MTAKCENCGKESEDKSEEELKADGWLPGANWDYVDCGWLCPECY